MTNARLTLSSVYGDSEGGDKKNPSSDRIDRKDLTSSRAKAAIASRRTDTKPSVPASDTGEYSDCIQALAFTGDLSLLHIVERHDVLKANHPLKGGRLSRTSTATRLKRSVFGGSNDELSDLEELEELPAHLSLGQNSKIKRAERQPPQDNPRNPATEGQIGESSTKASVRHEVLLLLSILNSC